jgi:Apea-like HEPN
MILLPTEAKTHFDEKANSLIFALKPLSNRPQPNLLKGSMAHKPITHLTSEDLLEPIEVTQKFDGVGRFLGFELHGANIHEFLEEDAAKKLEEISDKVAGRRELEPYCDTTYVLKHLIGWVRRRRLKEIADISWVDDLLGCLNNDICDQTILVPLDGIQIEVPFKLGGVSFYYFTKSDIDAKLQQLPEENDPDLTEFRNQFRKRFQGRVYTKFQCKAEKEYAQKIAFRHTDKALEILKLFNPAAFEIRAQCFLCRMGQVIPPQWHAFNVLPNDGILLCEGVEFPYVRAYTFLVNRELLNFMQHSNFHIADKLLNKVQLTDLEQRCLEAISHFSHGVASISPQDRLLHALVAVESLLLRDSNEPIQSNLSYRIALLTTSNLEERKKAKKDLLKGYTLRSKFVHHGVKLDDVQTANRVLLLCWDAMNEVMGLTRKFDSKQALLESLEDELLSSQ